MISRTENQSRFGGWRGVGLVAVTYIYFLIFAQFGFLQRLAALGIMGGQLKIIMGAMAAGGVATSLLAGHRISRTGPSRRLQGGLLGCATGGLLTLLPMNLTSGAAVAVLIGAALGLVTVTLVTHLNLWMGTTRPLLKTGLGVGLAYLACNHPRLFGASPAVMALVSAGLCLLGIVLAGGREMPCLGETAPPGGGKATSFVVALGCFTALVWLDSAAFFIIQNTPALKAGTWEGERRLWQNGGIHFLAALAGGFLLRRCGVAWTLSLAFAFLGGACLLLGEPGGSNLAALLYPVGVSLYSVALVAYPAYLAATVSTAARLRLSGILYAVAGWTGSGLGIGMAENLRRIPPAFVAGASLLFWGPWLWRIARRRKREVAATAALLLVALGLQGMLPPRGRQTGEPAPSSMAARGREVYISEGCIHCHSQYVRPNSRDEMDWCPSARVETRRAEEPPLIGNRRQGPDLTEVGNRRSRAWLRAHFLNPGLVSHSSPMPSYAHLFEDDRGEALVAYMESLGGNHYFERLEITRTMWRLSETNIAAAQRSKGAALLQRHCATCHSSDGAARRSLEGIFKRPPPDLVSGPFIYAPPNLPTDLRLGRIAQITKFGLPGTDMPGHEYLADEDVVAIAREIVAPSKRFAAPGNGGR